MLEIITAIFGGLGTALSGGAGGGLIAVLGRAAGYWLEDRRGRMTAEQAREERAHAREIAELQLQATQDEQRTERAIETLRQGSATETERFRAMAASYTAEAQIRGGPIINFLRASVRPVMALGLVGAGVGAMFGFVPEPEIQQAAADATIGTMSMVGGYYFVDRSIAHSQRS